VTSLTCATTVYPATLCFEAEAEKLIDLNDKLLHAAPADF